MQICFLKNILYVAQIVEYGTITAVAQKNGLKASNLSKLIKDVEKEFGTLLFIRTNKGLIPTQMALEISKKANEIRVMLDENTKQLLKKNFKTCVKIYISKGLEISDLNRMFSNAVLCSDMKDADVIITTQEPSLVKNMLVIHTKIGDAITQDLWLCAQDTVEAKELVTSVVLRFQH